MKIPTRSRFRRFVVRSKWQKWLFPLICILPYLLIIFWLISLNLFWIAQIMLAPLIMGIAIAILTFRLALAEYSPNAKILTILRRFFFK